MPITNFRSIKYLRWYDELIAKAKRRQLPKINTEMHHVWPRALGGGDEDANLVRLTYREHFIAHWLLTKTCSGPDLRKMQFALFAMTICANGKRIVSSWQYEVARRALYEPIQLIKDRVEKQKLAQFRKEIATFRQELAAVESGPGRTSEGRVNLSLLASKLTKYHRFVLSDGPALEESQSHENGILKRRRRKPGPSKRTRQRLREARALAS